MESVHPLVILVCLASEYLGPNLQSIKGVISCHQVGVMSHYQPYENLSLPVPSLVGVSTYVCWVHQPTQWTLANVADLSIMHLGRHVHLDVTSAQGRACNG